MIPEVFDQEDLSVSQCGDGGVFHLEFRALAFATRHLSRDDPVASIDDADRLECEIPIPGFGDLLPLTQDRLTTYDWRWLRPTVEAANDDHVGVKRLPNGIHIHLSRAER